MCSRRTVLLAAAFAVNLAFAVSLPCGDWEPTAHAALQAAIDRHEKDPDAYAVFDFDMTCAIGDCGHCTMDRLIKDLAFAFRPEDAERIFFEGVPDLDKSLDPTFPKATVRNVVMDCADLHRELLEAAKTRSAADVQATETMAALASKVRFLRKRVPRTFGSAFGYPWNKRFFYGMTPQTLTELVQKALDDASLKPFCRGVWRTPETKAGRAGVVEVQMLYGFSVPRETRELLRVLRESGIASYVVSGSFHDKVLASAVPRYGVGFDPEKVFGIHIRTNACGRFIGGLDDSFPMPWAAGKPEVVRNQIAVRHHGRDPVFVFGDANGDYAMLTSFTNLEVGLVFDTQPDATSNLGKLNAAILGGRAKGCYFLQGRDEARGRLNGAKTSKLAPLTCQ